MQFGQALDPLRSFGVAWKLLKQAPVTVIVGGLLLFFLEGGGSGGVQFLVRDPGGLRGLGRLHGAESDWREVFEELRPWLLILIPVLLCVGVAFFALSSWIEVGFARAIELALRTGRDEVGKAFSGGDRFFAMLLARLLCGLIHVASMIPVIGVILVVVLVGRNGSELPLLILVAFLVWFVVWVYLSLGLYLVNPIVAFENCSPTEAIVRSWKLASGHRLQLIWFALFQFFMGIAGLCLCCVGLFLAAPLTHVMRFEAYLALTKGDEYPRWWIESGKFPFDDHAPGEFGSPPVPPPLPPQG